MAFGLVSALAETTPSPHESRHTRPKGVLVEHVHFVVVLTAVDAPRCELCIYLCL